MINKEKIKVVLHCSASNFGNAVLINAWHRARDFEWNTSGINIGYHFVILNGTPYPESQYTMILDGSIEIGRPIGANGAHAIEYNDKIGICLIGNKKFTSRQYTSLFNLLLHLTVKPEELIGHYEVTNYKSCPNLNMDTIRKQYKDFSVGGEHDALL